MSGTLFVIATPIGNLEDMTYRGLRTLREVAAIACEDTRVTAKLLARYEIRKPLIACHEHSRDTIIVRLIERLQQGESIACVSDAGTPGVNDPGGKLVAAALEVGLPVVPIPGPSALTAAMSVCGFALDEFVYLGFVPHKKGRETMLRELAARATPSIFFESTHRIHKTLDALAKHLPTDRPVFVARELTKLHETIYRGSIDEVRQALQAGSSKGEFVIIVGPL